MAAAIAGAPAAAMQQQANQGNGVPLAKGRPETQAAGKLAVSSAAFHDGAMLDARFSEDADGVSPPLSWPP